MLGLIMTEYKPKRSRNIYSPNQEKPFKLSRTKVESFMNCERCFYLDRRLGINQVPGFPFNINSAVDELLKREFDQYRERAEPHPYMVDAGINAIPYQHEQLNKWRENFVGVQYFHEPSNFILHGAIDDVWKTEEGELIVVDYKATSKKDKVNINAPWQRSYKRQMEFYQWLLRQNDFQVSNRGYFVYCNGKRHCDVFNEKVEFDVDLLPYDGNDDWVDTTIEKIVTCLNQDEIPSPNERCNQCKYNQEVIQYY